jgi:hypothetical protein
MYEELSEMELSLVMMFRLLPGGMQEVTLIMARRSLRGCQKVMEVENDEIVVATGDAGSGGSGVRYASLVDIGDNHGDIRGGVGTEGVESGWEAEVTGDVRRRMGLLGH